MMREYHVKQSEEQAIANNIFNNIFEGDIADTMMSVIDLEEYDYTKSPLEQGSTPEIGKALRNNMLIDLISKRLTDPETFSERYTPGGFANSSFAAREMRELLYGDTEGLLGNRFNFTELERRSRENKDPEPDYDATDPMTIIIYNQQNQVAGKLIGIFANQNTNHAFASLMKEFYLDNPISFCGHTYNDLLHAPEGVDVNLNIAECLAASVDAVKDPTLNFLNFNTVTANSGGLLARLGYTPLEIGLLFNQPIIKELCEHIFNENIDANTAIQEVRTKYLKMLNDEGEELKSPTDSSFSADTLAKNIIQDRKQRENAEDTEKLKWSIQKIQGQLHILDLYQQISNSAEEVSQFITSTKFTASNAVGSTMGDMYAQQLRVMDYIKTATENNRNVKMKVTESISIPINNEDTSTLSDRDYLNRLICGGLGNPFAYEQAMYDMNVRAINLLNKYLPYNQPAYRETRNMAAMITKSQILDADTINSIHSDILVYMLSQQADSLFDGESYSNGLVIDGKRITNREYYTKVFPSRVLETIEEDPSYKEDYAVFKYMFPTENEAEELELRIQSNGLTTTQKDQIRDSWAALARDDFNMARDLFMYNFYKLGFGFSPSTFMHLAPAEIKESIKVTSDTSYVQFIRDILKGSRKGLNSTEFMKQYIRNHSDNYRFTYTARGDMKTLLLKKAKPERTWLDSFTVGKKELGNNTDIIIIGDPTIKGSKTAVAFMPCIALPDGNNTILYMAQGSGGRFNIGELGAITYVKVGKLGITNKSLNYQLSTTRTKKEDNTKLPLDLKITGSMEAKDPIPNSSPTIDRAALIEEIAEAKIILGIANGTIMQEEVNKVRLDYIQQLQEINDGDLLDTVAYIRANSTNNTDSTGQKIC